jgi:glycosyltransferase involved in cell wall biosynthesis
MRILLSASSFQPEYGGPARSVPQLAVALAGANFEVGLWAPDGSAKDSSLLENMPHVHKLSGSAEEAWQAFGGIRLLHDNGIWRRQHQQLARLAKAAGVPRVVSTRGMLEPWALNHKPLRKRLAWYAYQRALLEQTSVLHATATSEANQLIKLGLQRPIKIIPNGITPPTWNAVEALRSAPNEKRSCLFMSRLHPKKGLPLLLEAWARVQPKGWRLKIAGPDEAGHLAQLKTLVHHLDLDDAVRFLGPVEGHEKQLLLASADLMVLPTYSENFGIVVAEALVHGCPVITTHGAPWQVLETEGCGWWIPISADALSEAIRDATNLSTGARRAMGERGYNFVARNFAWPSIAGKFHQLYDEAIKENEYERK